MAQSKVREFSHEKCWIFPVRYPLSVGNVSATPLIQGGSAWCLQVSSNLLGFEAQKWRNHQLQNSQIDGIARYSQCQPRNEGNLWLNIMSELEIGPHLSLEGGRLGSEKVCLGNVKTWMPWDVKMQAFTQEMALRRLEEMTYLPNFENIENHHLQ